MTLPVEVVAKRDRPQSGRYSPSEITLYGVPLYQLEAIIGKTIQTITAPAVVNVHINCPNVKFYAALISAYAYQAHCYHLPEPAIMVVQGDLVPAVGFGFDDDYDYSKNPPVRVSPYCMWRVDKLDRTLQLEMTNDTFEEVILKRGLTGEKQPMAYASRLGMAHRGGKLVE